MRLTVVMLVGFALLTATRAWAYPAEAAAYFAEASTAFEAEDFSKARALFERALAAGMQGPAIHYNIGAAAYLGGDLPRAERAFREVARTPSMAALAYYNLGLVAQDRRDEREAREWFERTIQEYPHERLAQLASQRLAELPEARAAGGVVLLLARRRRLRRQRLAALGSIESSPTGQDGHLRRAHFRRQLFVRSLAHRYGRGDARVHEPR